MNKSVGENTITNFNENETRYKNEMKQFIWYVFNVRTPTNHFTYFLLRLRYNLSLCIFFGVGRSQVALQITAAKTNTKMNGERERDKNRGDRKETVEDDLN